MKKIFVKLIINRLKSKTPKLYKITSLLAAALLVVFFGADQMYDLCDLSELLCSNKEIIYFILSSIAGGSWFTVDKKSKNVDGKPG